MEHLLSAPDGFWCTEIKNVTTIWLIFHAFPGSRLDSMTFQDRKIWILNSTTFQDLYAPSNHNSSCQVLSVNGACHSLDTYVVSTPVKTFLELFKASFGGPPKVGDAEPEDRGGPGWERLRMICIHSILAWQWIGMATTTHGGGHVFLTHSGERESTVLIIIIITIIIIFKTKITIVIVLSFKTTENEHKKQELECSVL